MGIVILFFAIVIYPVAFLLSIAGTTGFTFYINKRYQLRYKTLAFIVASLLGLLIGILIGNHYMRLFFGDYIFW